MASAIAAPLTRRRFIEGATALGPVMPADWPCGPNVATPLGNVITTEPSPIGCAARTAVGTVRGETYCCPSVLTRFVRAATCEGFSAFPLAACACCTTVCTCAGVRPGLAPVRVDERTI